MSDYLELRWVLLQGPRLIRDEPLWSLVVGAPYFGDDDPARYAHPLRTVMVDGLIPGTDKSAPQVAVDPALNNGGRFKSGVASPHDLRPPRLLDLHVIAGAVKAPYGPNRYNAEELTLRLLDDTAPSIKNPNDPKVQRIFWTRRLASDPASFPMPPGGKADFVHVIAEPRPEPVADQVGDFVDQAGAEVERKDGGWVATGASHYIRTPPLRLVQGAIPIVLKKDGLACLKGLMSTNEVTLTPDGIELIATVRLPGSGDLVGGFLLAPDIGNETDIEAPSGSKRALLSLTLLPRHPATVMNKAKWLEAWQNAVDFKNTGRETLGVEFRTRAMPDPPALRWPLFVKNGALFIPGLQGTGGLVVDVPVEEIRVELRGSIAADGTPDGAAVLRPTRLRLADPDGARAVAKVLKAVKGTPDEKLPDSGLASTDLFVVAEAYTPVNGANAPPEPFAWARTAVMFPEDLNLEQKGTLEIMRNGGLSLAHDERRLAQDLRAAVGWAEPRRLPPPQDDQTAPAQFVEGDRPLLSGFLPLAEGWLQVPIPNLAPADLTSDVTTLSLSQSGHRSVLDGFVRFGDRPMAGLLTGFSSDRSTPVGATPPWSVTVASADSAAVIARVATGGKPPRVAECQATLREPDLTFRGLVWFSADRPDALEALPRLGAGAGSFIDLELRNRPVPDPTFRVVTTMIGGFKASFDSPPTATANRGAVDVMLGFNHVAPSWQSGPASAAQGIAALADATAVLVGADPRRATDGGNPQAPAPWPSVAWVKDDKTPFAAAMPMTRAAASAVRPLESRSLAPYVADVSKLTDTSVVIAAITWKADQAFPQRAPAPAFSRLAAAWPLGAIAKRRVAKDKTVTVNFGGVPFVAFGVPGVEVSPLSPGKSPWRGLHFAVRYDVPALDEAYATTALPPTTDTPSQGKEREPVPDRPVATALDWPLMREFWHEQDRCRQNSLVVDSYLAMQAPPADGTYYELESHSLVRAAVWKPKVSFALADAGRPYGVLGFDKPAATMTGDAALLGMSLTTDKITLSFAGKPLDLTRMVGWSPASFEWDDFEVDNQGFGQKAPVDGDTIFVRPVNNYSSDGDFPGPRFLATAKSEFPIGNVSLSAALKLAFWFRDVPLDEKGQFQDSATGTNFEAWLEPTGGAEWRLFEQPAYAARRVSAGSSLPPSFRKGRDRIPFFGFMLEPIRLRKLSVSLDRRNKAKPETVEILARFTLADDEVRPPLGDDLVILRFDGASGSLQLQTIMPASGTPMVFGFEAVSPIDPKRTRKTIVVDATPSWNGSTLVVTGYALLLPLYGWQATLVNPTFVAENGRVTITAKGGAVPAEAQGGYVAIDTAVVTVTTTDGRFDAPAKFELTSHAEIRPAGAAYAPVAIKTAGGAIATFSFLDVSVEDATLGEDYHALVVTGANPKLTGKAALLSVLDLGDERSIAFMFAARVDQPLPKAPNVLPLTCGRCEGEIRVTTSASGMAFNASIVRWELTKESSASGSWVGFAEVSAALTCESAIAWPKLKSEDVGDGRAVVKASGEGAYGHTASYRFLGHRLDFGLCGPAKSGWRLAGPWRVCIAARHELRDGNKTVLAWQGIETLAIGPADQIAPKLPTSKTEPEAVTFGARYRGTTPTMIQSGLGDLRTVLQGALGASFRQGFWTAPSSVGAGDWTGASTDWTLVASGFLGVHAPDDRWVVVDKGQLDDEHQLLRLPLLVVLDKDALKPGALTQDDIPAGGIMLSWSDSAAARKLLVRDRGAPAPASPAEADVAAALRAGALATQSGQQPDGDLMPALLVEQSFPSSYTPTSTDWRRQPLWLASAAMLSGLLDAWAASGREPDDFRPLSLVAASTDYPRDGKSTLRRGIAAMIGPVQDSETMGPSKIWPALISAARELFVEAWTAGQLSEEALNGQMVGRALARHANPVFAVARLIDNAAAVYRAAILPNPVASELPAKARGPRSQAIFADLARGYATGPAASPMRWLTPVGEGRVGAVRDYDDKAAPADRGSGLAGLGRQIGFPAQAGTERQLDSSLHWHALAQDLIWFSERRVPVYEPLQIGGMQSPPIPWLRQSPTRARLPADVDVGLALAATGLGSAARPAAQAFLPAGADALSVSERAGVISARRTLLLATATEVGAFDDSIGRFGRPAQAGSSARRWIRTPRPGPLPPNLGDPERDRRPEASPLLPVAPLRFVVGPADTVRGETTHWRPDPMENAPPTQWSATFVAAPLSDGILSERWDGSMRLRVELDVVYQPDQGAQSPVIATKPAGALTLLQRLMFPPAPDDPTKLLARGSLRAGSLSVALQRLIGVEIGADWSALTTGGMPWQSANPDKPEVKAGETVVWRSHLDLVLDVRASGSGGTIHPGLSAAIATGASEVDLRLVVHPTSDLPVQIDLQKAPDLSGMTGSALASGYDRPPVTLRWQLPAVASRRGGLPLAPSTLLFVDPPYEAALAHPPVEATRLIDVTKVADLPVNRGALRAVLSADRARVYRGGTIAFMVDARFERPAQAQAYPLPKGGDGDFSKTAGIKPLAMALKLFPRDRTQPLRDLVVPPVVSPAKPPEVDFATTYELSLGALAETDGSPARLAAGDVLALTVSGPADRDVQATFWNSESNVASGDVTISKGSDGNGRDGNFLSLSLRFTLTDEPVVEPPQALYAALVRSEPKHGEVALSLPLYAQSPLPWRVDFRNLKADFRAGLVRRSASFVWVLSRPTVEYGVPQKQAASIAAHIVKIDRNGQLHLPDEDEEFLPPERMVGI